MFLASHDKITEELKKRLVTILNYEDLILDIINICVSYYEQELYLVPDDKHMLLKVIGFGLNILDNPDRQDPVSVYKLDRRGPFFPNFNFLRKFFDSWEKFRILTKISIFEKIFDSWEKVRFLTKTSID